MASNLTANEAARELLLQNKITGKEYVETITRRIVVQQQQRYKDTHKNGLSYEEDDEFDTEPFITAFDNCIAEIQTLTKNLDEQIKKVSEQCDDAQVKHKSKLATINISYQDNLENFKQLDRRLYNVGNTAIRIGDRLDAVDQQRSKIVEIKKLLDAFVELTGGKIEGADSTIWTDDDRLHERAMLIKKLSNIVTDIEENKDIKSSKNSDRINLGKKRVEDYSNQIENLLLNKFDKANGEQDYETMKKCANTLYLFNGGGSCIQHYILKLNMFFNPDYLQLDRELARLLDDAVEDGALEDNELILPTTNLLKEDDDANDASAISNDSGYRRRELQLLAYFNDIVETVKREYDIIREVFPNGGVDVMRQLITRLFEQRLRNFIEGLLSRCASPHAGWEGMEGGKRGLKYLRTLSTLVRLSKRLIKKIAKFNIPDLNYDTLMNTLFTGYTDDYIEKETKTLLGLYSTRVPQAPLPNSKGVLAEVPTNVLELSLNSIELALFFIRMNEEAINRCLIIAPLEYRPLFVHRMMTILLNYLGYQYVNYFLEKEVARLRDKEHKKTSAIATILNQKDNTDDKTILIRPFLEMVQQVNQVIVLLQNHFFSVIIPNVSSSINDKTQCILEKNTLITSLQRSISIGISSIIDVSIEKVTNILAIHQKKNDFKTDDVNTNQPSRACSFVISFLRDKVVNVMKNTLDGKNLPRILEALAIKLQKTLVQHFKTFISSHQYTATTYFQPGAPAGNGLDGLKLMRDVTEYKEFVSKDIGAMSGVVESFFVLQLIAKLYIVNATELKNLMNDPCFANNNIEQSLLVTFIKQRGDFKTTWLDLL